MTRPDPFDRALLLSRRIRRGAPQPGADFLHARAAAGIAERLEEVNRRFAAAALVHPGAPVWEELLRAHPSIDALQVLPMQAEEVLPLEEASQDLIVCGLSLHWANDPVGMLIQMRRALRPDGLLLATLFGGRSLAELRAAFAEAEIAEEGGLSPRVIPMAEIRDLGALLQRAGFAMPVADSEDLTITYADPLALLRELRAMGETNAMQDRRRTPLRRATLARMAAIYASHFPAPDPDEAAAGRVRAGVEIVTLTGWAPGEGQPVPKRPGSASVRLADALGVEEFRLPKDG